MSILIETEEDMRRSKQFIDSLNAIWRMVLADTYTPAVLCYKTHKHGGLEYAKFGWSLETESLERQAEERFLKLTVDDGVYGGESWSYGRWIGMPEAEERQFHDDMQGAHRLHYFELDKAVALLRNTIARVEQIACPQFPPIAELYFDLAYFYYDHKRYDEHDENFEKGLSFYLQHLEQRPEYFGPRVADRLMKLSKIYLSRNEITSALGACARLKELRSRMPKDVAAEMSEDWLSFARYYARHSQVDEATACYQAVLNEIDWTKDLSYENSQTVRDVVGGLLKLGKLIEAEEVFEQVLEWGVTRNKFKNDRHCLHWYPCEHWFEPYFAILREQKRFQHLSQICEQLNIDIAEHTHQRPQTDLFGYIDRRGNWIIPQRFEQAEVFVDGVAKVELTPNEVGKDGTLWQHCLIDKSGNIVGPDPDSWNLTVPKGYALERRLHEGLIVVRKMREEGPEAYGGGSGPCDYGYADMNGNIVIEARFSEAGPFVSGTAIVGIGGRIGGFGSDVIRLHGARYGLIDRTGNYLIEPQFTRLRFYSDPSSGLFSYEREGGEGGVITRDGEIRSVLANCQDTITLAEGMAPVAWGEQDKDHPLAKYGSGTNYGYIDADGRIAIQPRFQYAAWFENDRAEVKIDGKCGFINKTGALVIDAIFDETDGFKNGRAFVKKGEHWGCIDEEGNCIVEASYDRLKWLNEDFLLSQKCNKFGLIDASGKVICDPSFDKIERFTNEFAVVTKDGLKGLIDKSGTLKVETRYRELSSFSQGLAPAAVLEEAGATVWGYVDISGNFSIDPIFAAVKSFSDGLAAVRRSGSDLWGYIDRNGKYIIDPKFDFADSFDQEIARIGIKNEAGESLSGLVNTRGEYVLPAEYQKVGVFSEDLCAVGRRKRQ